MSGAQRSATRGALALVLATGAAHADPSKADAAPLAAAADPRTDECTYGHDRQHLLGLLLDAGHGSASFGTRYMNAYRDHSGCGGLGFLGWLGVGAEVRGEGTSAMAAQAVGRIGGVGDAIGTGVEIGAGAATTFAQTIPVGSVALLFDFYYFGIGGSYTIPIGADRPSWLDGWELAVRVHIPLQTYDVFEEKHLRTH
jgi:hypothetical protein